MAENDQSLIWEQEWARRLPPDRPWIVRLDGRGFHRWTRGLDRPFDDRLRDAMVHTTRALLTDSGAEHAYTQSDEITLVFHRSEQQEPAFGGKLQKLVSLLAAHASIAFNDATLATIPEHAGARGSAVFDARAFAVPNPGAAITALAERKQDAERNAVQSVGHWRFGHKAMLGLSNRTIREQLGNENITMQGFEAMHTRGVALARRRIRRPYRAEEYETLPPKHAARSNPNLIVERTEIVRIDGPAYHDRDAAMAMVFNWRAQITDEQ